MSNKPTIEAIITNSGLHMAGIRLDFNDGYCLFRDMSQVISFVMNMSVSHTMVVKTDPTFNVKKHGPYKAP